jgi:hypothetical protein
MLEPGGVAEAQQPVEKVLRAASRVIFVQIVRVETEATWLVSEFRRGRFWTERAGSRPNDFFNGLLGFDVDEDLDRGAVLCEFGHHLLVVRQARDRVRQ